MIKIRCGKMMYIYIYIYVCVCVCVCVIEGKKTYVHFPDVKLYMINCKKTKKKKLNSCTKCFSVCGWILFGFNNCISKISTSIKWHSFLPLFCKDAMSSNVLQYLCHWQRERKNSFVMEWDRNGPRKMWQVCIYGNENEEPSLGICHHWLIYLCLFLV